MSTTTRRFTYSEGIPEYWIAEPEEPELILFALGKVGKCERVHPEGGVLRSRVLSEFEINASDLFAQLMAE